MQKLIILILLFFPIALSANAQTGNEFPKPANQQRSDSYGSIFGNNGLQLFGGKGKANNSSEHVSSSTNSFLWHAALDVVQFMPLASTDFNGGVINTDWYDDQDLRDVKYKVNIIIKSSQLSTNAISVTVFKKQLKDGQWKDVKASKNLALELEDRILTKARELKNTQDES